MQRLISFSIDSNRSLILYCLLINSSMATETESQLTINAGIKNETSNEEKLVIIGSRLNSVDRVGMSPVTIIDRKAIMDSGATSVANILRALTANTHGSRKQTSGRISQGQATVSLRSLGEQRTLILINGHRIANSASLSDSQNINLIPLSAVERIEILKDGASSIYGSDAIGGVINVILRKNIDTQEIAYQIDYASLSGSFEKLFSLSGGTTSNTHAITYAIERFTSDQVFARDIYFAKVGLSQFGYPGNYIAHAIDPDSGLRLQQTIADRSCPESLNASSTFPHSVLVDDQCMYNFANVISLSPSMKRDSVMLDASWELSNNLQFIAHINYSQNITNGTYAPPPSVGGVQYLPSMSALNPNNPTAGMEIGFDIDQNSIDDIFLTGPFELELLYRNLASGLRITKANDQMLNAQFGIDSDIGQYSQFSWLAFYSDNTVDSSQSGLVRRANLQNAIDDASFDIFSVNGETDLLIARSFTVDTDYRAKFDIQGTKFILNTSLFDKINHAQDAAIGFEYTQQNYHSVYQDEFSVDAIDGRPAGGNTSGYRDIYSLFYESNHQINKKFTTNLSIRLDDYSDFSSSINPSVGFSYRLSTELLLRSTIGTGFRAPSLDELFSRPSESFGYNIDSFLCHSIGDSNNNEIADETEDVNNFPISHPCYPSEFQVVTTGNSHLKAEESVSFTLGFVYQAEYSLGLKFNFFHQRFSNQILVKPVVDILQRELEFNETRLITRDQNRRIVRVDSNYENFSGTRTNGLDIEAQYEIINNENGNLSAYLQLTTIFDFETEDYPNQGYIEFSGRYGYQKQKNSFGLAWAAQDYNAGIHLSYIPSVDDNAIQIDSSLPLSLTFNWRSVLGGSIHLGIDNFFKAAPGTSQAIGWPYYNGDIEDISGRSLSLRYQRSFSDE